MKSAKGGRGCDSKRPRLSTSAPSAPDSNELIAWRAIRRAQVSLAAAETFLSARLFPSPGGVGAVAELGSSGVSISGGEVLTKTWLARPIRAAAAAARKAARKRTSGGGPARTTKRKDCGDYKHEPRAFEGRWRCRKCRKMLSGTGLV